MSSRAIDHYELLELDRNACPGEITAAFRRLAKRWHPDVSSQHGSDATERMQRIAAAYEVLRDPDRRAAYDRSLHLGAERPAPNTGDDESSEGGAFSIAAWWAPAPGSPAATVVADPAPPPGFLSARSRLSFRRSPGRR